MGNEAERIGALNDQLRTTLQGGKVMLTNGIAAFDLPKQQAIFRAVQAFNDFNPDNDPHQEHDFGLIEVAGERVMFKIDYFDRSMRVHSPDPSDPKLTVRVLTVMLADEY